MRRRSDDLQAILDALVDVKLLCVKPDGSCARTTDDVAPISAACGGCAI